MTTKTLRGRRLLAVLGLAALVAACRPREPSPRTPGADAAPSAHPVAPASPPTPASSSDSDPQSRPQSAERCRQTCNGDWSAHGLAGVVSCLCRTRDFGKDCRDRAECQGECLLDPVRTEVQSSGPPATGRFIGKCSEFVTAFGCVRRIPLGAAQRGPVDLSDLPPEICLD